MNSKQCKNCKNNFELTADYFYRNKNLKDGFFNTCKKCTYAISSKWRRNNIERVRECERKRFATKRESTLKRRYGIRYEDYKQMLQFQENKCYICNKDQSELSKCLYIDHNHNTKEVRKLLCTNCNAALGMANEDPALLIAMANYIEAHSPSYEVPVGWC